MHQEIADEVRRGVGKKEPGSAHVDDRGLIAALGAALHLEVPVRDECVAECPGELLHVLENLAGKAFLSRSRVPDVHVAHNVFIVKHRAPQLRHDVLLGFLIEDIPELAGNDMSLRACFLLQFYQIGFRDDPLVGEGVAAGEILRGGGNPEAFAETHDYLFLPGARHSVPHHHDLAVGGQGFHPGAECLDDLFDALGVEGS